MTSLQLLGAGTGREDCPAPKVPGKPHRPQWCRQEVLMLFCAMGCPGPPVRGSARITLQQHLMAWMSPWVSGQEDTDGPVGGKAAAHNHTHSRVHTQSHITHTQILTHNHIHSLVHNAHTLPCTHTLYTRTNSHRHTVQAYTVHATHTPVCVWPHRCVFLGSTSLTTGRDQCLHRAQQ